MWFWKNKTSVSFLLEVIKPPQNKNRKQKPHKIFKQWSQNLRGNKTFKISPLQKLLCWPNPGTLVPDVKADAAENYHPG